MASGAAATAAADTPQPWTSHSPDAGWALDKPKDTPIIRDYIWHSDGCVSGYVFGKAGFPDGAAITTSPVAPSQRHATHVVTATGSAYRLGEPARPDHVPESVRKAFGLFDHNFLSR